MSIQPAPAPERPHLRPPVDSTLWRRVLAAIVGVAIIMTFLGAVWYNCSQHHGYQSVMSTTTYRGGSYVAAP